MKSKTFAFYNCELFGKTSQLEKIFENYPHNRGKFTYHLSPSQIKLVQKYGLKNYWIDYRQFPEPEEISGNCCFYIKNDPDSEKIAGLIRNGAHKKIRFVINLPEDKLRDKKLEHIEKIAAGIQRAADNSPKPESISLAFAASGITGFVDSLKEFYKKYPVLSREPHFELSSPASSVENSIFISLASQVFGKNGFSFRARLKKRAGRPEADHYNFSLELLRSMGYNNVPGVLLIACPTCSRARIDVISLARSVYEKTKLIEKKLTVAVMGCEVNGPGEASHADIGVAGGLGSALLLEKGGRNRRIPPDDIGGRLMERINEIV